MMINTVDSMDYVKHNIEPEQVMNLIRDFESGEDLRKRWMLGLLTNKLLLAIKTNQDF